MEHSYEEVHQLAHALPEDERIQLANSLYESVSADEEQASEAEITAAWGDEIKRRLDEIDSGAVKMTPLEDVLADMDAHIARKRRA
jgi:putative addiction module component (TIGR02574 family)